MATRIRLKRTGAKNQPHYRVVVVDQHKPRDGRTIEDIGHYNPRTEPPTIRVDEDRALHWLMLGAQPSDTVRSILKRAGVMSTFREARPAARSAKAPAAGM